MKTKLLVAFCAMFAVLMSACGVKSDPNTEEELVGTWIANETVEEDGEECDVVFKLELGDDNTADVSIKFYAYDMYLGSVKAEGAWHASADEFELSLNENSMEFSGFLEMMSKSEREEAISDIAGDTVWDIVSLTDCTFVVDEDGDRYHFERQ